MHERDASQVAGGRKTGHVAHDAAAKGDERRLAFGVRTDERLVDFRNRLQHLEALAVGHEDRLAESGAGELRCVKLPHQGTGDDEPPRRRSRLVEQAAQAIEDAVPNRDRVRARRRRHIDAGRSHEC